MHRQKIKFPGWFQTIFIGRIRPIHIGFVFTCFKFFYAFQILINSAMCVRYFF